MHMTTDEAHKHIGKRVAITIDVPDTKYGLPLFAGDTGVIGTGAGEIGFVPDRYLHIGNMLQYAYEGKPFVAYCVLEGKQACEPIQMALFDLERAS